MTFAQDIIDRLFPATLSPNDPLIQEPLQRTRTDRRNYRQWKKDRSYRELGCLFAVACLLKQRGIRCSVNVHLFQSQAANAFSISCSDYIDPKSFQHYFDYLRERIIRLGYIPQRSDREMLDRVLYVETVERHSFQLPNMRDEQNRLYQLYGNIYLEFTRVNDRPSYLKLMATYQTGPHCTPAFPFEELMRNVFGY